MILSIVIGSIHVEGKLFNMEYRMYSIIAVSAMLCQMGLLMIFLLVTREDSRERDFKK